MYLPFENRTYFEEKLPHGLPPSFGRKGLGTEKVYYALLSIVI